MGFDNDEIPNSTALLLPTSAAVSAAAPNKIPKDSFNFAYIIYFILGIGYFVPWNAFITAVDYFSYLYPDARVDRIFIVAYMLGGVVCILLVIFYSHKSTARVRINAGLVLYTISLVVVPLMDLFYIKGRVGLYNGFYVTVAMLVLGGVADALVQGSLIGSAGELPERYMQACVAGTAASGVLVSLLRVVTKAAYPQNAAGLRKSANLYFTVGIVFMVICIILYNVSSRLPVMKYYAELKIQAVNEEKEVRGPLTASELRSRLWQTVDRVKWYGFGIVLIYLVTLAIYPGYVTEDVHSAILKDWYAILLIATYNVFDLVGKSLTSLYVPKNSKVVISGTTIRLLFFPLFYGCLHGPKFFRTEIPVTILTGLLGLTNGYMTSVLCILAPKSVQLQHAESAGILIVLFSVLGLAVGSIVSWFWVI